MKLATRIEGPKFGYPCEPEKQGMRKLWYGMLYGIISTILLFTAMSWISAATAAQGGTAGSKSGSPQKGFTPSPETSTVYAGDAAPNFTLKDLDGKAVTLSSLYADKPVFLVFGSYT